MAAIKLSSVLFAFSFLSTTFSDENVEANHHFFNVQPGGEKHLLSRYLGPFECTFVYAAQGGTNEEWFFDLDADHDGKLYTCSIGRPSGSSYLVFSEFRIEINGAEVQDAEVYSRQGEKLSKEEYSLDKEANQGTNSNNLGEYVTAMPVVLRFLTGLQLSPGWGEAIKCHPFQKISRTSLPGFMFSPKE